jgi:hypothetical protein
VSGAAARDFRVTSALHFLTRRAGASLSGQRPPDMNLPTNGHRVAAEAVRCFQLLNSGRRIRDGYQMNRLRASELVPQSSEEWSRVDESLQSA